MQSQGFSAGQFFRSRTGLVLLGLLVVAAYYLIAAHRVHVVAVMPYSLLFLCLGLHLFMHRGHGGHAGHEVGHHRTEGNRTGNAAGASRHHTEEIQHER